MLERNNLIEKENNAEVYVLSEGQEKALDEADKNILDGKLYSHEEAQKIAKKWRNEKF